MHVVYTNMKYIYKYTPLTWFNIPYQINLIPINVWSSTYWYESNVFIFFFSSMRNCLPLLFHHNPCNKARLPFHNRHLESDTKAIDKVIPPFNGNKIIPYIEPQVQFPMHAELEKGQTCIEERHFVKIKVTKKQLKSMLRNGEKIQVGDIAVRLYEKSREEEQGTGKWRPSLATIPEVRRF